METSVETKKLTLRCQFCDTWNRIDAARAADKPKCGKCGKPMLLDRPIKLDDETFRARVDLDLDSNLKLPVDSSAAIVTAGILGDRYIQLTPGAEDEVMKPGEQIAYTESALVLERLIGKFLVNVGDKSKDEESPDDTAKEGTN